MSKPKCGEAAAQGDSWGCEKLQQVHNSRPLLAEALQGDVLAAHVSP